jgi:hypothetical protein
MRFLYVLSVIALSSCSRPGDGRESGSDKHEWSILQSLESAPPTADSSRKEKIQFMEVEGYSVVRLLAPDAKTPIWIMMDPRSPPFYKQMPPDLNYSLTKQDLEIIWKRAHPITTVEQALESHLESAHE